jgi:hypothetical protein
MEQVNQEGSPYIIRQVVRYWGGSSEGAGMSAAGGWGEELHVPRPFGQGHQKTLFKQVEVVFLAYFHFERKISRFMSPNTLRVFPFNF